MLLLAVATVDGIRIRLDDLPARADVSPQGGVIEVAAIRLAHGVVEVLYIGEHRNFLHRTSHGCRLDLEREGPQRRQYASHGKVSAKNQPGATKRPG